MTKTSPSIPTTSVSDLAYIQVSTGNSLDSTDLVYNGIPVRLSCLDVKGNPVIINNMNASVEVGLLDSDSKPVLANPKLLLNYLPTGKQDYVMWVPQFAFETSLRTAFSGSIKLVLTLSNRSPFEASNKVQIPAIPFEESGLDSASVLNPINGQTDVSTLPIIVWNYILGATNYNLKIATDPDFKDLIYSIHGLGNIFAFPSALKSHTTYYWAAQVNNGKTTSDWLYSKFTTR